MHKEWHDVEFMAKHFGIPKSWWYQRTREKGPDTIPLLRLGKYVRFCIEDVTTWLQKREGN